MMATRRIIQTVPAPAKRSMHDGSFAQDPGLLPGRPETACLLLGEGLELVTSSLVDPAR